MVVRINVCGLGRVGKAFLDLLMQKHENLKIRYGLDFRVTAAVDIGGAAVAPAGLPLQELMTHLQSGRPVEEMAQYGKRGMRAIAVIESRLGETWVEATPTNILDGEPAMSHLWAALSMGMHVATAAKGPLVLRHGELKALAQKSGARLMISAATAAALPTLDVGLICLAGTELIRAEGILNGTTNYILTRMTEAGVAYEEALAEAQRMGIAEPDPSLDVEGRDTANKILLIANEVFQARLTLREIPTTGITRITMKDIEEAKGDRRVIKLIGQVEKKGGGIAASVAPQALPWDHPLASVRGTEKALSYVTDTMDRVTVSGGRSNPLGAAAALLKDLIRIHRNHE
jgi:homoserine dehydrogenase